jgi:uncharacterized protein (TIGR02246 family)
MKVHCNCNHVLLLAAALAAAGTAGFLAVPLARPVLGDEPVRVAPRPNNPRTTQDEQAIQKNQVRYIRAFNGGDAKALAAFWAADGEFVDAEGKSFRGRGAIEKELASFFAGSKGLKLEVSTDSLRFISPGVALESGTSRVIQASDGESNVTSYSIVHTKRDGQWQLASVRESAGVSSSNYEHLRSLEWLVGSWTAKNGGPSLELTCEWTAKRNFLLSKYILKDTDNAAKTGIQIIGWDPAAGTIVSWIFDSDGGFASVRWNKDGNHWVQEATGVTRDGAEVKATNILTPVDQGNFNWQSVQRSLDQVPLPDTALLKATRVKAGK